MKKLLLIGLTALLLMGCSAKETSKSFTLTEELNGQTFTYVETYAAVKDRIVKGTLVTTIAIAEPEEGEIDFYKAILDEQKACPYGVEDSEGNITVGCSKYITFDWTFDEENNTFNVTEVINFKEADKNKEDVYSEEAGGSYNENEYYSMELFEKDLLDAGYTVVE